jgi:glutamine---fructose-6-phosphate transaminase (isomerizing)
MSRPDPAVAVEPDAERGEIFLGEIREQPAALLRLLDHDEDYSAVARELLRRDPQLVRLVGHGSSDNAATYGIYAFGLLPHLTGSRDSISLSVYYGAEVDFSRSVVVALSQSGQTPDVVDYVERARSRGAFTIAVTNGQATQLELVADATLPLAAGAERGVAASKTYVNQLAALALLAGHTAGRGAELADAIRRSAELLSTSLSPLEAQVRPVATSFAYVGRMYVIGRGLEFATAREVALKLTETCRIAAEPLTATDLAHGPVAALDPLFPVWAIASDSETLPALREAVTRVREAGATVVASGSEAGVIEDAAYVLPVPQAPHRLLAPLLSVVPGQLLAGALAEAKGLDADRPEGLSKVTIAR